MGKVPHTSGIFQDFESTCGGIRRQTPYFGGPLKEFRHDPCDIRRRDDARSVCRSKSS